MAHRRLRSLVMVLAMAVAAGWVLSLPLRGPRLRGDLWRLELASYDWRLRMRAVREPSPDIVIVGIDTSSLQQVGTWPWPRSIHAQLIDALTRAGARAILLDIVFDLPSTPAEDNALVRSVRASGRVVLTGQVIEEMTADSSGAAIGSTQRTLRPIPALARAAAAVGIAMLPEDSDGVIRRVRLSWESVTEGGQPLLFTGLQAAALASGQAPETYAAWWLENSYRTHPWVTDADYLLDYRAPPPEAFPYVSYASVITGEVSPEAVRGKIVLVGMKSELQPDLKLHPLGSRVPAHGEDSWQRTKMPGVEAIANVVDMLLGRRVLVPCDPGMAQALPVLFSALIALLVMVLRFWGSLAATAALLLSHWVVSSAGLVTHGVWLPVASVLVAGAGAYVTAVGSLWVLEERTAQMLRRTWGRRVSGEILEQILAHPELRNIPGRRVDVTIMFMDLANFTTLSTEIPPEQLIGYLNQYMTLATETAQKHGGVVHKFIGDGILIAFGEPVDIGNHAQRAVDAAHEFQSKMAAFRERIVADGGPALWARVGIHSGEVIAGDIGAEALLEYTIVGKAVNLASRLEALNKRLGSSLCVSYDTYRRLENTYGMVPAGEYEVAGYPEPVTVYVDEMKPVVHKGVEKD